MRRPVVWREIARNIGFEKVDDSKYLDSWHE